MALQTYAIKEAIGLALQAEQRGVIYMAEPNTPLGCLTNLSTGMNQPVADITAGGESGYTPNIDYIQGASSGFGAARRGEVEAHQRELATMAETIAKRVDSHFRYARGVVQPVVIETINRFNDKVKDFRVDLMSDITVKMYDLPMALKDAAVQHDIKEFAGKTVGRIVEIQAGEVPEAEMIEAIGRTDEIKAWLATKGEGFLTHCWKESLANVTNGFIDHLREEGVDEILAFYLLAQAYMDRPPKGTMGALSSYNLALAAVRDQAANQLSFLSDQYADQCNSQLLIRSWDSNTIWVNKAVFDNWQNTNAQSLIVASCMDKRPAIYVNQIEERQAALLDAWKFRAAALKRSADNNRYVTYRDILSVVIPAVVVDMADQIYRDTLPAGQKLNLESHPLHLQFHKQLPQLLQDLRQPDIEDMASTITRLVCLSVFHFTDAYKILHGIDRACRANPQLDAASAQAIVRTEYVTDFVFDQLVIRKII